MLPFLKPKTVAGLIISHRKPDESKEQEEMPETGDEGLVSAAEDIIRAYETKDAKKLAEAFKAAFQICDSMPHEEGPHEDSNDFDSQNEKAARDRQD